MIEPVFRTNNGRHLVKHPGRDLTNAVLYPVKTGCQWRLLPKDFPPHDTVWSFYRRAVKSGNREKATDVLVKKTREEVGRKASPTYGIIDSQSVKTTLACEERGFDGGKVVPVIQALYLRSWLLERQNPIRQPRISLPMKLPIWVVFLYTG
jgi:transposase